MSGYSDVASNMKVFEMNRSVEGRIKQDSLTGHDTKAAGQKSDCDDSDAKNTWTVGKNVHDIQLLLHMNTHFQCTFCRKAEAQCENVSY